MGNGQSAQVVGFARWLFDETGGQPFFVAETLKALLERGALVSKPLANGGWMLGLQPGVLQDATQQAFVAPGVRAMLQSRLARLSPAAGTLLAAAAVLGQSC